MDVSHIYMYVCSHSSKQRILITFGGGFQVQAEERSRKKRECVVVGIYEMKGPDVIKIVCL